MKYNDNTAFAIAINISAIFHLSFTGSSIYKIFKKLKIH